MGVFGRVLAALAAEAGTPDRLILDATHLGAHRTTASLPKGGPFPAASDARPPAGAAPTRGCGWWGFVRAPPERSA